MAMAASTTLKHLPFFLILVLVLSSVQIEARVNKFFSKFIHTDRDVVLPVAPSPAPLSSLAPTPAPAPFFDESQNAYGLYGRDSDDGESKRTIADVEEEILAEDGEASESESHKSGYPTTKLRTDSYESPKTYEQYQGNYENNGYRNSEFENGEYRNSEYESEFGNNGDRNYQYQSNFEDDGFRRSRYEPTERQGMSDTRFMESGRYYHDINSRNGEEGESYGSKRSPPYEFDSMEEYEKREGILP